MKTNLQIRGLPVALRDRLRRRAARQGRSMSDYLVELIRRDLELPTEEGFRRRLRRLKPVKLDRPAAGIIRELREERDREIERRLSFAARKRHS